MVARRRRVCLIVLLCVCSHVDVTSGHVSVTSSRDAANRGIHHERRRLSSEHAARWRHDADLRKLTSQEQEQEEAATSVPQSLRAPGTTAAPPCGRRSCLSSADPQNDFFPFDEEVLNGSDQQHESPDTSSGTAQVRGVAQSSSDGPKDRNTTLKSLLGTPRSRLSQPRSRFPPVGAVRTIQDALARLANQRRPSTDTELQLAWNTADGDATVADAGDGGMLDAGRSMPPLPGVLSEFGRRSVQLFWQPLTRADVVEAVSVDRPSRVRRAMWPVKRPRYYRHNGDYWTRRNWRVNQMRVWGKRRHQLTPPYVR